MNTIFDSASGDRELAMAARTGSMQAFEELVRRYQVPLLRFLQRGPCPGEAEDLLQETFLRVHQSMHRYHEAFAFKSWVFTIAYRMAVSAARRPRGFAVLAGTENDPNSIKPIDSIVQNESRCSLWAIARQELTPPQYLAVWLHYVDDIPPREIAAILNQSGTWVRTTLHRARQKLSSALAETVHAPEQK